MVVALLHARRDAISVVAPGPTGLLLAAFFY